MEYKSSPLNYVFTSSFTLLSFMDSTPLRSSDLSLGVCRLWNYGKSFVLSTSKAQKMLHVLNLNRDKGMRDWIALLWSGSVMSQEKISKKNIHIHTAQNNVTGMGCLEFLSWLLLHTPTWTLKTLLGNNNDNSNSNNNNNKPKCNFLLSPHSFSWLNSRPSKWKLLTRLKLWNI